MERSDPSLLRKRSKAGMATSFLFMVIGAFIFGVVFTQAMELNLKPEGGDTPQPEPICWRWGVDLQGIVITYLTVMDLDNFLPRFYPPVINCYILKVTLWSYRQAFTIVIKREVELWTLNEDEMKYI